MTTRRSFLKTLVALGASLALPVRSLFAGRLEFDRHGEIRFYHVGQFDMRVLEMMQRLNAAPWRGHKAGTVQFRHFSGDRSADGTFHTDFVFVPAPPPMIFCDGPMRRLIRHVTASEIYGTADFNAFDFGEVVT